MSLTFDWMRASGQTSGDGQTAQDARQREQTQSRMSASIQMQTAAIRKQMGQKENPPTAQPPFFIMDAMMAPAPEAADCDALPPIQVRILAEQAGKSNRVNPDLIEAVMRQESAFKPCAVSNKGAQGLMQLMPDTATDLGVGDALDPEQNVLGGAKLLRTLLDRYAGDLNRALAAYNAGPVRVDAANGVPPFPETVTYVDTILRNLNEAAAKTSTSP